MAPLDFIGLEEHFAGQVLWQSPSDSIPKNMFIDGVESKLADLTDVRIKAMDQGNMSIQVTSHIPTVHPPKVCSAINDQLFDAVQASNGRLRGFACLPMGHPDEIPAELERCVKKLGFVGALIPNHAHGIYYDGKAYWPMFEKAQELDVPIYIHPTTTDSMESFAGNYDEVFQSLIAGPTLCWHTDIAQHVLRLLGSGIFDAYPRVKIILGHNGEVLPFMLYRIQRTLSRRWKSPSKRDFMTVWNENIWITTSGMWNLRVLEFCLSVTKPDRVLYSVDYPFEDVTTGLKFMQELQKSQLVTEEQFEMISRGNAKSLLRL